MQAHLTSLANPKWANEEKTRIDCEITTSQFGEEILPFTADADDVEAHGRLIFADIVSGKYGDIADYVAQEEDRIQTTSDIPVEVL
jgi:hypothetical protein